MQLLADVSRPILDVADDELVTLRPVRNPYVRRRERRNTTPKAAPAPEPAKTKPAAAKPAPSVKVKEEPKTELKATSKDSKSDSKPVSKESTPVPSGTKKAAPKRGAPGGIMQSFAKAAAMPKKASTPKPPAPEEADIQSLALSDDGEDDAVEMPNPKSKAEPEQDQETEVVRKGRTSRQEALKRMMEESSEEEEESEKEDTPMEEADEPVPEEEKKEDSEPAEVVSSAGDGRRRGRRQVMKKKTVMDEQGYLGKSLKILEFDTMANDHPTNTCDSHSTRKRLGVFL